MAKIPSAILPTAADLGTRVIQPTTDIVRMDVSNVGKGMQALGAGVQNLAAGVREAEEKRDQFDLQKAESDLYISLNRFNEEAEKEPYREGQAENWDKSMDTQIDTVAKGIRSSSAKARFLAAAKVEKEQNRARLADMRTRKERDYERAGLTDRLNKFIDMSVAKDGLESVPKNAEEGFKNIDSMVVAGHYSQEEGVNLKRAFASDLARQTLGKAEPESRMKFLEEDEIRAKDGKNMLPMSDIIRMKELAKKESEDQFAFNFVDANYRGSVSAVSNLARQKGLSAEQRSAVERRAQEVYSIQKQAKADAQDRSYKAVYTALSGGLSYEQAEKKFSKEISVLDPSHINNLKMMGTKSVEITPWQVKRELNGNIEKAYRGDTAPLIEMLKTSQYRLSKEDQKTANEVLGGTTDYRPKITRMQLIESAFPKKDKADYRSKLFGEMAAYELARGRDLSPEEEKQFVDDRVLMSRYNPKGWDSQIPADNISDSGALYSNRNRYADDKKLETIERFRGLAKRIGPTVADADIEENAVALGRVAEWAEGKKFDDAELKRRYDAELFLHRDDEDRRRGGGPKLKQAYFALDKRYEFDASDEDTVYNALISAHRKAAYSVFLSGQTVESNPQMYEKIFYSALEEDKSIKKYTGKK